jgi:hypothetical protein
VPDGAQVPWSWYTYTGIRILSNNDCDEPAVNWKEKRARTTDAGGVVQSLLLYIYSSAESWVTTVPFHDAQATNLSSTLRPVSHVMGQHSTSTFEKTQTDPGLSSIVRFCSSRISVVGLCMGQSQIQENFRRRRFATSRDVV